MAQLLRQINGLAAHTHADDEGNRIAHIGPAAGDRQLAHKIMRRVAGVGGLDFAPLLGEDTLGPILIGSPIPHQHAKLARMRLLLLLLT
jgi:hypothetical protein